MASAPRTLASGLDVASLALPPGLALSGTGGSCGVRVEGVDLAEPQSGATLACLRRLADHAGFLVVRGQERLSRERQEQVTAWFGRPYLPPGVADGLREADRRVDFVNEIGHDGGAAGRDRVYPHTDNQPHPVPPDFSLLRAVEVPPAGAGGVTEFANLYQAWDELGPVRQRELADVVQQPFDPARANAVAFAAIRKRLEREGMPEPVPWPVRHPVGRIHPVTGRIALWVSVMTERLLRGETSLPALRDELVDSVQRDSVYTRHEWLPGDLVVFDNRCVLHRRSPWAEEHRRVMVGSQAGGSAPF